MSSSLLPWFVIALTMVRVSAHSSYVSRIPNGDKIVDSNGDPVQALGHVRPEGGGMRNPFGEDFASIGNYRWTTTLCERDSDGDGLTNGVELGDPNCIWSEGDTPSESSGLSHPGVSTGSDIQRSRDTCEGVDTKDLKVRGLCSHNRCPGSLRSLWRRLYLAGYLFTYSIDSPAYAPAETYRS